ncbi:MAG: hypothetical protein GVY36_01450 [Verrucomicrobia bacterium]|jgi:hypothetical protein|nr:hypothetical protein [Verrucomicrobiota bacterium]
MKMIASRELAAKPAAVWQTLKEDGAVVVTKNGQPEGIFYATSSETWLEDVQDLLFARARRAASELRKSAAKSGIASMTQSEIEAEIRAVRQKRK